MSRGAGTLAQGPDAGRVRAPVRGDAQKAYMAQTRTSEPQGPMLFNPLDPESVRDPYPMYRRLRETEPVYWHEDLRSWVLSRYAECQFVLSNPDLFTVDFRRVGIPTPPELLSIQTWDPPSHTPLRAFLASGFHEKDLAALQSLTNQRAEQMLARLAEREVFDFVTEFADPLALATITTFLGVEPPASDESFARLNDDLDRSMDSGLATDAGEAEQAGLRARAHFNVLANSWLDRNSQQGLIGYVSANSDSVDVPRDVLVNSLRAFFHAGFEVPSRFLGNAMLALLRRPGAISDLRLADSLEPALQELVRYSGPVHALSRACTEDTEVGGKQIARGQIVTALIGAANRDPAQFSAPDELVLNRKPNPHLGFGRGIHSCLGFPVGLIEARSTFSTIARSYPRVRLAGNPVPRRNATLRGLASLPLALV